MKYFLAFLGIVLITIGLSIDEKYQTVKITDLFSENVFEVSLGEKNEYYRDYDFSFVQNTTDFVPDCKQDLLNIYYTAINAGKNQFTFYCGSDYDNCISDLESIANNKSTLSLINNYVHPYNGFKHIETEYDSMGKITIIISKNYTEEDIRQIEAKLDLIEPTIVNENATLVENLKSIHDYIITNTTYDVDKRDNGSLTYKSDTAYGSLVQGYGICSGYTDAMQLMLERLGVENFKVASDNHIWNVVNIDGSWKHLDLTWDDPILDPTIGLELLIDDYFLITTEELIALDQAEHNFDQNIYTELKIKEA